MLNSEKLFASLRAGGSLHQCSTFLWTALRSYSDFISSQPDSIRKANWLFCARLARRFAASSSETASASFHLIRNALHFYEMASAPAIISVNSCVMEPWRALLYFKVKSLIISSALLVAESIACILAPFSLATASTSAP